MTTTTALIVAAGRGARFGGTQPKQYSRLGGKTILRHSLEAFCNHGAVDAVRAVIHRDDADLYRASAEGLPLLEPVAGGDTRQESVRLGLESLAVSAPAQVLIHDGARPLVDPATIDRVIQGLGERPGAIAALQVVDSLKQGADQVISGERNRDGLWRAQTPQGFHFEAILEAHRQQSGQSLTDDAAVATASGLTVGLVQGAEGNIKVTTNDDLATAEGYLKLRQGLPREEVRSGQGFDVHRFGPGDRVTLCGLAIPHDQGLVGHSDADVALHALTDAILGALGAGDIGEHFPPSDPQWAGAASDRFLAHAGALLRERGGRLANLDLTLICEVPKIGPHRQAMAARIAEILDLAPDRVSVKATTTEGLGFTGRREGIAAQAIATISLPGSADERD